MITLQAVTVADLVKILQDQHVSLDYGATEYQFNSLLKGKYSLKGCAYLLIDLNTFTNLLISSGISRTIVTIIQNSVQGSWYIAYGGNND